MENEKIILIALLLVGLYFYIDSQSNSEPTQKEIQTLEQEIGFSTSTDNELICNTNEDGTAMGLKYERLVPVLVNAIKELSTKNEALLARIVTLENI